MFLKEIRVFEVEPKSSPYLHEQFRFAKVPTSDLYDTQKLPIEVAERQKRRFKRFDGNYCYGTYFDNKLIAFAWLLPHDIMRKDTPAIINAAENEAEITGAETLPDYRGMGAYGFQIRNLAHVAHTLGFSRVYIKTNSDNHAALRSFEKEQVSYLGTTRQMRVPFTNRTFAIRRRFR